MTDFPTLAGPGVKGASTRSMVPWVATLCSMLEDGSEEKAARAKMMGGLRRFQQSAASGPMFLSKGERQVVRDSVEEFCQNYCLLASLAMRRGEVLFNVTLKHHMFHHMAEQSRNINPRVLHTYSEESFVGCVAKIYAAMASGPLGGVQARVLKRYLVALELTFHDS